ncbi:hypothetical protein AWB66_05744 [Caballeronia telluris]|uniref:Aspartate racemase n=1 Tax=Caballeronia telluris TaxID=326475 RepID=A0A158KA41_9BURK|nr:hypothetical protein [Caballeronia telluris]SAL77984.1 hypothetical protein AWB66_05744 [Caballeronia telluris]
MSDGNQTSVRKFGVVGGLGPLASADVFFKLIKSMPARATASISVPSSCSIPGFRCRQ